MDANEITDGITSGMELRQSRGLEIAALVRIDKDSDTHLVPFQFNLRQTNDKVGKADFQKALSRVRFVF